VIDHLRQQHLQYSEMVLRERERLAQRQSEAIVGWLSRIEADVESAVFQEGESIERGRRAFVGFSGAIAGLSISELLVHPMFDTLYFLSGRLDTVYRETVSSVLPSVEKDLLFRRMIFLYSENLLRPQIRLLAKAEARDSTQPLSEGTLRMLDCFAAQLERMRGLMASQKL
jgi:hypothetical protein